MEARSNIFLVIDRFLKITTSSTDLLGCDVTKSFEELKGEIQSETELARIISFIPLEQQPNRKAISVCLDWTLALCAHLIHLVGQFQPSVAQEKSAQSLITLLVSLGIRPNILPSLQLSKSQTDVSSDSGLKHRRLVASLVVLLRLVYSPFFGAGLMQRHLVDILASLCQLCYAPIQKNDIQVNIEPSFALSNELLKSGDFESLKNLFFFMRELEDKTLSADNLIMEMWADRRLFTVQLDRIQSSIYQPLLVQALLTLQNSKDKPKPRWLKSYCGQMLSSALLRKPSGLVNVLDGMLQDVSPVTEDVPNSLQSRCQAIAKLLCQTPAQCSSTSQYLEVIAPQMLHLLSTNDSSNENCMSQVAVAVLINLQIDQPTLAKKLLFEPLTKEFVQLLNGEELPLRKHNVLIPSVNLENSIQTLHKVFELCGHNRISLAEPILLPISKVLLELSSACGTSYLRKSILELLQTLLQVLETETALNWLEDSLHITSSTYKFQRTATGGMEAVTADTLGNDQAILEIEDRAETLWFLIEKLEPIQARFFIRLLEKLSFQQSVEKSLSSTFIPLLLVQRMAETIETEQLLKDTEKVAHTLQSILNCFLTMSRKESTGSFPPVDTGTPLLALTLISLLLEYTKLDSSDWQHLQCLIAVLEEISLLLSLTDGTRKLAKQLKITIATRGAIPQPKLDGKSSQDGKNSESFESAWRYLLDPEIPLKCHGLVLIKRLLLLSDPETLKHKEMIFEALQHEHLLHQDSCVYQSAIQALAVLFRFSPKIVLSVLISTFACHTNLDETRLKVAEALVQICKQSSVLLSPQDEQQLLIAFLNVSKENNRIIRTSALSCLADICKHMRFAICPQLQEVLMCLVSFLRSDSELDVKRAATMAIAHLLRGLGKDMFQMLNEELRDIHRVLIHSRNTSSDERLVLHLNLALEEIKEAMRQSLEKSCTLTKEIRILDPF